MTALEPDAPAIVGGGLVTVLRRSRRGGADGYTVLRAGAAYSEFAPDWTVKPAVVGETVCEWARFSCYCGRTHLTVTDAAKAGLQVAERCGGCGGDAAEGAHGPGACV